MHRGACGSEFHCLHITAAFWCVRYIETLPAGQGMLAVCCAVVITTFIIDIIKHRTLGYRPEMVA